MEFSALKAAEAKLLAKQRELGDIVAQATDQGGSTLDLSKVDGFASEADATARITELHNELETLGKDRDAKRQVMEAAQAAMADGFGESGDSGSPASPERRHDGPFNLGAEFIKAGIHRKNGSADGPLKTLDAPIDQLIARPQNTLMTTAAGWAPETTRTGLVVDSAQRPVEVTDLFPVDRTGQAAVVYMEETTFTNNAAEAAEGAAYGEAALELTERSEPVRKIAVFLPVTDEQLEDEPMAESYINRRLPFMIRQRLDLQLLVGNGTAPNLRGVTQRTGIQTQAKGADTIPDAIHKALTKVRVTGRANPTGIVLNPADWERVRLLKDTQNNYLWGSPATAGVERIWGLPVAQTSVLAAGSGLVGDFNGYSSLVVRRGLDVQVSNSHGTFFVEGKQAIRADLRAALMVTRAAAFANLTGLAA